MGGGKGGGGGGTTTTLQKSDPWSGIQPYLTKGYEDLSKLYSGAGPQLYPDQTYAAPSPIRRAAQQYELNYAANGLPQDINAIRSSYGSLLNAADVNSNPYLAQAAEGAIRPVVDQLQQNILPGIRSGAMQTGQYGGSRQGLAEGNAITGATRAMGDMTSGMYSDAYSKGLDSMSKAMLFGPQMIQMGTAPAQYMRAAAGENEAEAQKAIDEAKYRYEYGQKLPFSKLADYLGLLQGSPGGQTTATQSGGMYGGNPVASALGTGMAGYSLGGAMLPEMAGIAGGPMGMGLALLLSAMG